MESGCRKRKEERFGLGFVTKEFNMRQDSLVTEGK